MSSLFFDRSADDAAAVLDNPIWAALTSGHRGLAIGSGPLVRRYPEEVAPFVGLREITPETMAAMAELVPVGGQGAVLFTCDRVTSLPPGFEISLEALGDQMVLRGPLREEAAPTEGVELVPLGAADVPEMLRLVEMTRPGPFGVRTYELGGYLGIRTAQGELVAMTGERMRPDPYVEVSAVCVHPDYRGRGYAQALIAAVVRGIERGGGIPFLHTYSDNTAAIALYGRLGFVTRRQVYFTRLAPVG